MGISRRQHALLAAAGECEPARRWYVLTIFQRLERTVEAALKAAKVEAWLPVAEIVPQRRSGRKPGPRPVVHALAWPGYIFVKVANTAEAWAGLETIAGVRSVLGTAERPAPVSDEDVLRLKVFLEQDEDARVTLANGLKQGDRIEITDGAFTSLEGPIVFLDDAGRLRIDVDIFGRIVPVDLDLAQVRKIG